MHRNTETGRPQLLLLKYLPNLETYLFQAWHDTCHTLMQPFQLASPLAFFSFLFGFSFSFHFPFPPTTTNCAQRETFIPIPIPIPHFLFPLTYERTRLFSPFTPSFYLYICMHVRGFLSFNFSLWNFCSTL